MTSITLYQKDELLEVREDGALIGYVEERKLFGINAAGYAVPVGEIDDRTEIIGKLHVWRESQQGSLAL